MFLRNSRAAKFYVPFSSSEWGLVGTDTQSAIRGTLSPSNVHRKFSVRLFRFTVGGYLFAFMSRFVSRISFCRSSMRSFSCSCVGSMSLIRTLLYVATPIGVLIPRKDHYTSALFISEQISKPIVGLSSSAFNKSSTALT